MEQVKTTETGTAVSTILWYAIFIWFASSLFSQSFYMALNGEPYDAIALLKGLGPLYYVVLFVELTVWISLGTLLLRKLVQKTWISSKVSTIAA